MRALLFPLIDAIPPLGYHRIDMKILAVDTTTSYYSLALTDGDHVLAELNVDAGRKHSERLMTRDRKSVV